MTMGAKTSANSNHLPPPAEDEQPLSLQVDWTPEEEIRAKRK